MDFGLPSATVAAGATWGAASALASAARHVKFLVKCGFSNRDFLLRGFVWALDYALSDSLEGVLQFIGRESKRNLLRRCIWTSQCVSIDALNKVDVMLNIFRSY